MNESGKCQETPGIWKLCQSGHPVKAHADRASESSVQRSVSHRLQRAKFSINQRYDSTVYDKCTIPMY